VAKPNCVELTDGRQTIRIPILYEDRSVLAIDKPAGWMLIPFSWQKTNRNLQAAIVSSIAKGDFWARSRNLKFLRNVHRLDGDTSGILLFAKSPGALETFSELFETRKMEKVYLAVGQGTPKEKEWVCRLKLGQDADEYGRMKVDELNGKESETRFTFLQSQRGKSLIEARPLTGRTHQIRVHLAETGCSILGDDLYGSVPENQPRDFPLALRAVGLSYVDPFQKKPVRISAPAETFKKVFGFGSVETPSTPTSERS
jgi:RluA family pseudouridine synthase